MDLTQARSSPPCSGALKAATEGQRYALNLSAPFLCQFFKAQMHAVLPFADYVFGNESEVRAERGEPSSTHSQRVPPAVTPGRRLCRGERLRWRIH